MIFLLASIPLLAGDAVGTDNVNQGGPPIAKRNFSEAEIQSALTALGITLASPSTVVRCDIENSQGGVTNTVTVAQFPGAPVYWLRYQPGSTFTRQVRFMVIPLFTGSPLAGQLQTFNPNSTAEVLAPFAIPFWGHGLVTGPWILVVQNDLGETVSSRFTVQ